MVVPGTTKFGIRSSLAASAASIRFAPQAGNYPLVVDVLPYAVLGTNETGTRSVFGPISLKWYTLFTGNSSRATDYNVVAYIYSDNP